MEKYLLIIILALLVSIVNGQTVASLFTTTTTGSGTYYGVYTSGGACTLDPTPPIATGLLTVAITSPLYTIATSGTCGMCIQLTGNGTGSGSSPIDSTFTVFVNNECPSCNAGSLDLGETGDGIWDISWIAVPCPNCATNKISWFYQGTNDFFMKVQARNHVVPVASVSVNTNSNGWVALVRTADDFWQAPSSPSIFPLPTSPATFQIQATSVLGDTVTDTIVWAASGNVLSSGSGVQFPCTSGTTATSTTHATTATTAATTSTTHATTAATTAATTTHATTAATTATTTHATTATTAATTSTTHATTAATTATSTTHATTAATTATSTTHATTAATTAATTTHATTAATTSATTGTVSSTTGGTCSASVSIVNSPYSGGGSVAITVTNTGTKALTSVTLTITGTISPWNLVLVSGTSWDLAAYAYSELTTQGTTFTGAGLNYSGTLPSFSVLTTSC